jgi:hypothetical protein
VKEIFKCFVIHILSYSVVLASSIVWLYAFMLMRKSPTGYIWIGEPNKLIWTTETIMFVAVILWSLKHIIKRIV